MACHPRIILRKKLGESTSSNCSELGWVPKMSLSDPVKSSPFEAGEGEISACRLVGVSVGEGRGDFLNILVMMLLEGEGGGGGVGGAVGDGEGEIDGVGVGEVAGEQSLVFTSKTGEY